jgi:hypothetical protein
MASSALSEKRVFAYFFLSLDELKAPLTSANIEALKA